MCGVFGAVDLGGAALRDPEAVLAMGEQIRHRGPDHGGHLASPEALIGARRLAIVDLEPQANQPFQSPDQQVWLVCNGEIYNAPEIRRHYRGQGYPFRSHHNDVESILPLYLEYGVDAVARLDGMFALAIWDLRQRRLLLARDRAGEKPLFYRQRGSELQFASEIQALIAGDRERPIVSAEGLRDYLTLGYCTAPRTMLQGIMKLEASTLLQADAQGLRTRRYWDAVDLASTSAPGSAQSIVEGLAAAVTRQLQADVPVGIFTSGGVDSSLLAVEVTRHLTAGAVNTYALQFTQASYDESQWADRLARRLGTRHQNIRGSDSDLHRALQVTGQRLGEPLSDPAVLPTFLLAEAAAQDVRVVLSGEGADELFGGYPTYLGHRWAERFRRLPAPLRAVAKQLVRRLPVSSRKVSLSFLARRFIDEAEREMPERHIAWFGALGPLAMEVGLGRESSHFRTLWQRLAAIDDPVKQAMLFDQFSYLAENLLSKVDRTTMLCSIEARAPFLDWSLMELALRQPASQAVSARDTKLMLKRAALSRLPREFVQRRKRGLSVPVSEWINGALAAEFDRLLDADRLRRQALLDPAPVRRLLIEHRERRADHGRRLWPLFVLQRWHERWLEN
jgi:asparagine synthase (glutamine-hydrolysing)